MSKCYLNKIKFSHYSTPVNSCSFNTLFPVRILAILLSNSSIFYLLKKGSADTSKGIRRSAPSLFK